MSDQLRRNINVTARIISEADGIVEYIASDATLDSYNESVLVSGWRFNFLKLNAPFVDSHNYWSIEALLGKILAARVEGNQLVERVQWAKDIPEHKLATIGWKLTLGEFLKAVSVGFRSLRSAWPQDTNWANFVTESGMTPEQAAQCRRIFVEQEQLELSACVLGANPSAVAKAYQAKCLTDADLAGVGFDDDDLHFLSIAGPAAERDDLDPVSRLLISREMTRISQRKLSNQNRTSTSPSTGKPDGVETARRQAEERAVFVKQLETLLR